MTRKIAGLSISILMVVLVLYASYALVTTMSIGNLLLLLTVLTIGNNLYNLLGVIKDRIDN